MITRTEILRARNLLPEPYQYIGEVYRYPLVTTRYWKKNSILLLSKVKYITFKKVLICEGKLVYAAWAFNGQIYY